MKPLVQSLHTLYNNWNLAYFSYSTKIKCIIGFSSCVAFTMIGLLIYLQAPFMNVLRQQKVGIAYYNSLLTVISAIEEQQASTPEFQAALAHLQQKENELSRELFHETHPQQQKLTAFDNELKMLAQAAPFMPDYQRQQTVQEMLPTAIHLMVEVARMPLGSDSLTYRLAHTLYVDLPQKYSQKELLSPPLLRLQIKLGHSLQRRLEEQIAHLLWRQYSCIVIFGTGLGIVLLLSLARTMRTPLADFQQIAEHLAAGNLQQRATITSDDEVAEMCKAFNKTADLLERAVTTTSLVAHKLNETITTIATSAQIFEQNFFDQDQTISQIAKNTNRITKASQEVVKALQGAQQIANATKEFATTAQNNIYEIEAILMQTATAARTIVDILGGLEVKVAAVRIIIDSLVNVADQANLLAINTALMAHTQSHKQSGFGTIAAKIRDLASRMAFITLKMEASVQAIVNALGQAVTQIGQLSQQITIHGDAATATVEQLHQMASISNQQVEIFEEMHAEIGQQESEALQIHETISLLAQSAKIASHSVHTLYTHIQYLGESSITLQTTLDRFSPHNPTAPITDEKTPQQKLSVTPT